MTKRDKQILALAERAVNYMAFACQIGDQGPNSARRRYAAQSEQAMKELRALLKLPPRRTNKTGKPLS